jgi:hypothetical protein
MNPNDSMALAGKGIVLREKGFIYASINFLQMAVGADSLNYFPFKHLGDSLYEAKRY